MFRGYRYAIAAIVGFLTLGNSPAQQERQRSGDRNHQVATTPGKPQTQNSSYHQTTNQGCKGTSRPDLACDAISAQASLDQAVDANAGFWLGIVQATIGVFTLGAAIAAAIFAWFAAHHTESAANAAREANRIAKAGGELEYRPIMIFSHFSVEDWGTHIGLLLSPVWKNIGRLPAKPIKITTSRGYTTGQNGINEVERVRVSDVGHNAQDMGIIGAGELRAGGAKMVSYRETDVVDNFPNHETPVIHGRTMPKFSGRKAALFICRIEYESAFSIGEVEPWYSEQIINYIPSLDGQHKPITDVTHHLAMEGCPAQSMT